jgi:hypothetical protein
MDPLSPTDLVSLITQQVALSMPTLIPVIAACAGVKIVLDLIFDYTMGITGRTRGR